MKYLVYAAVAMAGTLAVAQLGLAQDAERAKLYGSWQAKDAGAAAVWMIQEQGSGVHVINSQGDRKITEFVCELGKECEVKDAGKKVKVTLYFNGGKLVMLETRGDEVVKRRFGMAADGDLLEVENIPMSPNAKTETVHFTRLQTTTASAKP